MMPLTVWQILKFNMCHVSDLLSILCIDNDELLERENQAYTIHIPKAFSVLTYGV